MATFAPASSPAATAARPTTIGDSDQQTARSAPATIRVRSTIGHRGELGADDRQPDPAEHVEVDVGQAERPVGVGGAGRRPAGQQQATRPMPATRAALAAR